MQRLVLKSQMSPVSQAALGGELTKWRDEQFSPSPKFEKFKQ